MAGVTDIGGRGEVMSDDGINEDPVTKFMRESNAPVGTIPEIYAKDQLIMMYALPEPIKKRLRALKKLQISIINMEADFCNEVHNLEIKYQQYYKTFYEKRAKIITGKYEPNEDELHPDENLPDIPPEIAAKLKLEQSKLPEGPGIPNFWLTIFRNVGTLNEITFPEDEALLKHLIDIRVILTNNPMGFVLEFIFTENDYFSNRKLTKEYEMKCHAEESDPFSFEGPEILKTKGCDIDWKQGKNITIRIVKKKQKHKSKGSIRTITKTEKNDSFFNFFSPPILSDETTDGIDENIQLALTSDFEIGHYLKDRVIPRALLYYTGEALEDEESYEDDDEEEDDEDEDDDEEESATRSESSSGVDGELGLEGAENLSSTAESEKSGE